MSRGRSDKGLRAEPLAFFAIAWLATLGIVTPSANAATYTESALYSFCSQGGTNCTDGALPAASMIQAHDGNFYGTTLSGGAIDPVSGGAGTVFEITPSGTHSTLYTFCSQGASNCTDGTEPRDLIEGPDGNFYGITQNGGANTAGTIFRSLPAAL